MTFYLDGTRAAAISPRTHEHTGERTNTQAPQAVDRELVPAKPLSAGWRPNTTRPTICPMGTLLSAMLQDTIINGCELVVYYGLAKIMYYTYH